MIIVVFSDTGSAFALIPVVRLFLANNIKILVVISGPAVKIFSKASLVCEYIELNDLVNDVEINRIVLKHKPIAIISGAGAYNMLEHSFRIVARELKVFSFGLVDGWGNYKIRFQREQNGVIVSNEPDLIGVRNKVILDDMKKDHFDKQKLVVVGSPHVDDTIQFVSSISGEQVDTIKSDIGLPSEGCVFVYFVSGQPIDFGYTIESNLLDIIHVLNSISDQDIYLIIKNHPREQPDILYELISKLDSGSNSNIKYFIDQKHLTKELLCIADVVIGSNSTALYEATLCGLPSFSNQIGRNLNKYPENFLNKVSEITVCHEKKDLINAFRIIQQLPDKRKEVINFTSKHSAQRILDVVFANIKKIQG